MPKNKPKKHHYVPRFILKNFSNSRKNYLFVFDKKLERIYKSSIEDEGSEKYYYESSEDFDPDTETKLSQLEAVCAPIITTIISQESIASISDSERSFLCLLAAVQMLRTNNQREQIREINKIISQSLRSSGIDPNHDVENFKELSDIEIKNSSIKNLRTIAVDITKHFVDKTIRLLKAPQGTEFYISDNPITLYNYFPRPGRGNLGVGLKGIEMQFPLSPRLCLDFFCSETVNKLRFAVKHLEEMKRGGMVVPLDMSEPKELLDVFDKKVTKELKPENVEFNNSLQVIQSSRYLFSDTGNFDLALDMLKTNPELKIPVRMSVFN